VNISWTFGRVIVEAMLFKKGSRGDKYGRSYWDEIEDGKEGILVNKKFLVEEILENILKVYENQDLYHTLSFNAYGGGH